MIAVALLIGAVSAQTPEITAAGWAPITCPGSSAPCLSLTVVGNNFGASQGQLQKGDFLPPAPPPPQMPWDTPTDLLPSNLATRTGGNGVCVARSLYTGDGFHYRFCPFQRMEHFSSGGWSIGSLGTYAGVLRDYNNANCPGGNAIIGMKFLDGSLCNGVPSTSTINFVCLDVLGPGLAQWGTNTPMINAAIRSPSPNEGCSVNTTLPLPGACDGARFTLCGSPVASPNPLPTPSPSFGFTQATVTSWSDGTISAYMPGTVPPPAVRVQREDGVVSGGYEPEAGPMAPSASPIPVPFPENLLVVNVVPNKGVRGVCTPVTIMLAGLAAQDIVGSGFNHVIRLRMPTGPASAQFFTAQGLPGPVDGAQPVPPDNGLLNVTIPCVGPMGNFPSFPHQVPITIGSYWSQASLGTHLIRAAVCDPSNPNCLQWTYCNAISPSGDCT